MAGYYSSETWANPLTNIRRERVLPVRGEVLVETGDQVEPAQVVARAEMAGDFQIVPVARLLGVPSPRVPRHMRVALGDEVEKGQVIAARRGLNALSIRSPMDGMVTASGGGRVLIEEAPAPFELSAYLRGTVTGVLKDYGVVIEATGALIQGVWGAGGEGFGVLKCVVNNRNEPIRAKSIDSSCHGTILIGGTGLDQQVLELAQESEVRGIVTGGLPARLIAQAEQQLYPVVVTEGIGEVPMSTPLFRLLAANDGREAVISGEVRSRWGIVRPEIAIPLPTEETPSVRAQPGMQLDVGVRVRAIRAPHLGVAGMVVALRTRAHRIETGARVRGAEVDIGEETPIFVPLANLEILR